MLTAVLQNGNMKAKICIIGNGEFANKVHYPSLFSFDDVEVMGILAFDEVRLKQTAERYNIHPSRVYAMKSRTDYKNILSRVKPDGVYVIGPPEQMLDCWIWCLENHFNLFIEKPLGITLHQAEMLTYLAEKNKCITQVSFQRRSSPIIRQMRAECLKRGAITHAVVEFNKCEIRPMLGARDRMLDDFTHCVDTARWVCGGEVLQISSGCRRIATPDINWIGATLNFDNGATCFVTGNWSSGRRVFRVNMHSHGICAEVEPEKEAFLYADGDYNGRRFDTIELAGSKELFVYGGFQQKNREFIDSLRQGKENTSSPFRDAVKTMQICDMILKQASTLPYTLSSFTGAV